MPLRWMVTVIARDRVPTYQIILGFLAGIACNYAIQAFGKALYSPDRINKYLWLGLTHSGAVLYLLAQLLLSLDFDPPTLLAFHRLKLLALLVASVGWMETFYGIYFPRSRYPVYYALLAAMVLVWLPFDLFLRQPVSALQLARLGITFSYHFGTTGPAYLLLSLLILVAFSLVPIYRFLLTPGLNGKARVMGCLIFAPGVVGGLNDFSVTYHMINNIMIAEYLFFLFPAVMSIQLFREDAENARTLAILNDRLEELVQQRTTELEVANSKLQSLAETDPLTGLCNRRRFTQLLILEGKRKDRSPAHAQDRAAHTYSVLFLDLDNFKYYNDTFGHGAGDLVLARVAALLSSMLRATDTAARYGGDEFILLLPGTNEAGAGLAAGRILAGLRGTDGYQSEIAELTGRACIIPVQHRLGCSIGVVADGPERLRTADEMLIAADIALYAAKAAGKNCAKVYTEAMERTDNAPRRSRT